MVLVYVFEIMLYLFGISISMLHAESPAVSAVAFLLVSPLLFHYSTNSGLSYTQKLKYTRQLPKERMFSIAPLIGYNFKYKEFYWAANGNWLYSPSNGGRIFIEAGNGVPQELRTSYAKLGHSVNIMDNISITATAAQLRYT
jgi:hypothetical protein